MVSLVALPACGDATTVKHGIQSYARNVRSAEENVESGGYVKQLLLAFLLIATLCYARTLNFDENGNLIDSGLDKKYNIMSYYSLIYTTHDIKTIGYEITFRHYKRWNFNIGFSYKLYYSDLTYSLYKNKLCLGLITGYSTKVHAPVVGLALTWRVF